MTEPEVYETYTDKVAEVMADTDVRMGYWAELTAPNAGAGAQHMRLYYVRLAGAALTVLAPVLAEGGA